MGKIFPGKVEAFSVFRIVFAFGTVTTIVLNIALDSLPGWVYVTVIIVIQLITTGISTQIMDLKDEKVAYSSDKDDSDRLVVT